jgi:molybdate transport system ATP-binding protein
MVEGTVSGELEARLDVRHGQSFLLDIELSIPPGRTVALLGPNGAGKSTAVAALAGLIPVDSGCVRLGEDVLDDPQTGVFVPPEERGMGVVFQDYLLFPHMSVVDNVAFGLRNHGLGREEARWRARGWIDRLGLDRVAEQKPGSLSGGQAQRVALARALVTEPRMLLLDEPLSALDVTTRAKLRRELAEHLTAFAGPRLMITHDPAEAFLLSDEIHIIEDGRITQVGSAEAIRLRPRTSYAADLAGSNLFVGYASDGTVDAGGHLLQTADPDFSGEVLVSIRPSAISLHRSRPEGSPRNSWEATIGAVERLGERARVAVGQPLPLTAEVTTAAADELDLAPGHRIWVSIKATEIGVELAPGPG